jgi:hypothetical protein
MTSMLKLFLLEANTGWMLPAFLFIKGTQAWDCFEFFLPKSKPYMTLVNIREKFRFFSFDFSGISIFEYFRDDWASAEPSFIARNMKIF